MDNTGWTTGMHILAGKRRLEVYFRRLPRERVAAYQLVGEVTAHQGYDG